MNTEDKPTAGEQAGALADSIARLKQIATAHAPAFVALCRGTRTEYLQGDRPGLKAVSRLIGQVLLADAQYRVLRSILIEEGVISAEDFDRRLAAVVGADAVEYAVAINTGEAGLTGTFGFDNPEAAA